MSKKAIAEIAEALLAGMACGRQWHMTNRKPTAGKEINNAKLSQMLERSTELAALEWESLHIPILTMDNFVHLNGRYCRPTRPLVNYQEKLLEYMTNHKTISNLQWGDAFKTSCSRQNYVSKIRRKIFDEDDQRKYHKSYHRTMQRFLGSIHATASNNCKENAILFQHANFRMKYKLIKKHKRKEFCIGDTKVDEAFSKIKLVNPRVLGFRTNAADWEICKQKSKERTRKKNRQVVTVRDSMKYLKRARTILETCQYTTTLGELGFALMLTSGRRMSEIFNGRSVFKKGSNANSSLFTGQLKTDVKGEYEIPLLCTFELFSEGLKTLRQKQGNLSELTNDDINTKYSSNLNKALKTKLFFPGSTNHDCRRFYIQAIWKGYKYEKQYTFNAVAMHFLGHSDLQESLNYNYLLLGGFLGDTFHEKYKLFLENVQ